jgi:Lar family restriction alleviation protein
MEDEGEEMNKTKEKLRSCPFCGGKAKIIKGQKSDTRMCGLKPFYKVYCPVCQNRTWTHLIKKNAIAAWNKRVKQEDE